MMIVVSPESKEAVLNGEIAKDAIPEFYLDDNMLPKPFEKKESNEEVLVAKDADLDDNVIISTSGSDKSRGKKDRKEKKEKKKEKKEKRKDKTDKKETRKLKQSSKESNIKVKYRVCLNKKRISARFQPSFQYLFLAISLLQWHHLLLVVCS